MFILKKEMTSQRKLRVIKPAQTHATSVAGITIPPEIARFFKNTYFSVTRDGTEIILASGTQLSKISEQINSTTDSNSIDLENYRI